MGKKYYAFPVIVFCEITEEDGYTPELKEKFVLRNIAPGYETIRTRIPDDVEPTEVFVPDTGDLPSTMRTTFPKRSVNRVVRKQEFLDSLPRKLKAAIKKNAGVSYRQWDDKKSGADIAARARESGLFSGKTATLDIISTLRRQVLKSGIRE